MSVGEESRYAIRMNRYFLIPLGIWPLASDASLALRLLQKAAVTASYWLISFLLVPCALHTFLEEPSAAIKLKLIGPMSFHLMAVGKYCSLVSGVKEIGECFRHVEEDWKFYKDRRATLAIMRSNARLGHFLTLLCAAFMYGGGFFYHTIMPLSSGRIASTAFLTRLAELELRNSTDSTLPIPAPRALTYPVYERFMRVESSPWYELVFLVQFASGFVLYTITVGACSLAAGFVVHVCAQLDIVMRLLDDFARGGEAGSADRMREIVDKHVRALSFAKRVEKNLNVICFVEFVGCTLNICFLGYYFITEWESRNAISTMTYCILLVSFTFNIFIFCFIGDILTEQCKKVGEVTYAIDWYKLPGKTAVDVIFIIAISSCCPARITAGKMVYLSMSSFCNVIKTAATYLNLLRTVMI
ncbi:odorant receptor 13a-like isoform X2 [Phymastichus coffea]|uniref:odorant receptor 13a-like isoform X2 n=1 Tax=Phymastichus coffea TaxID=108790 RepID=UPI00273CD8C5|nr:odorant receptor 13a-like isoform X2 [Phymastichus coffea]